jgi:hypothetical protein
MSQESSSNPFFDRLARLYLEMGEAYDLSADKIGLSCDGCPDNCCDSYFRHHTYVEWAYVWEGMKRLSSQKRQAFIDKARHYVEQSQQALARGEKPNLMCPFNDHGLCQVYDHRLMICRMHGVPNRLVRPDGKEMTFPGCFRSQDLCQDLKEVPVMDRTGFYQKLASLEMAFLGPKMKTLPRVDLTLAEMVVEGPPKM